MYKNKRSYKKQLCLKLPLDIYNELERKAAKRKLDKTNYISYLIQQDRDDMFSGNASKVLNNITCSTEQLLKSVSKDDKIRPFVVNIKDGVNELWRYLR